MTAKGKIGRLPAEIQEQVNQRMESGEQGRQLAAWLNSLPEVQAVLAAEFEGKLIREQNLSQWRKRGYAKWLHQKETQEMAQQLAGEIAGLQQPGGPSLTDLMSVWVASRYVVTVQNLAENETEPDLKALRELCRDVVALRRGDQIGARLKIAQEQWECSRVGARREAARLARLNQEEK